MTRARSDGLFFLVLGIITFILFGAFLRYRATDSMVDFKMLYYGGRTLLEHGDPYNQQTFSAHLDREFGESGFVQRHASMKVSINLPTAYFLSAPLAMLPFRLASIIWSLLSSISLITAAILVWRVGASYAPILSGVLAGFALINGAVVIGNGNSAGLIVGLCVIGAWSFVTESAVWLGVFCFAVSLVVKPQDAGFLWLFFLLGGVLTRKRALQSALIAILLAVPASFWVSRSAPQWIPELHANLVEISAPGGNCDPGPTGLTSKSGTMEVITDLQTVIGVLDDSPSFYNTSTFLVCGMLLLAWGLVTFRSETSPMLAWLALAAIAPLTLLVTYHRAYDARLLFLAFPACAMLWMKGDGAGRASAAVTAAAVFFTGEVPLAFLNPFLQSMHLGTASLTGRLETILLARLAPLSLLAMCLFFLSIYWRQSRLSPALALSAVEDRAPAPAGQV
jgi:hypothetical protein